MAGAGDSLVKQYPPATHQFLEVPLRVFMVHLKMERSVMCSQIPSSRLSTRTMRYHGPTTPITIHAVSELKIVMSRSHFQAHTASATIMLNWFEPTAAGKFRVAKWAMSSVTTRKSASGWKSWVKARERWKNLSHKRSSHAVSLWGHAFFSEFGYCSFGLLEAVDAHAT